MRTLAVESLDRVSRPNGSRPTVSVVIPVYNAKRSLLECLQALTRDGGDPDLLEVLVVDNGSSAGEASEGIGLEGILGEISGIRLLQESKATSYAARNRGARQARGEILAFLDADCRPRFDWVSKGMEEVQKRPGSIVAGRVRMISSGHPNLCEVYDCEKYLRQEELVQRRNTACTANFWVRRETFAALGGFDEELISGGDEDFCVRARSQGVEVVFSGDVEIEHPARRTLRALGSKSFRIGVGSAQRFRKRRLSALRLFFMAFFVAPRWRFVGLLFRGRPALPRRTLLRLFLLDWVLKLFSAVGVVRTLCVRSLDQLEGMRDGSRGERQGDSLDRAR